MDSFANGTINIYDVSTPSAPRFIRNQAMAGISGVTFTGLTAMGTNYLIGISPNRTGVPAVGHDVVVIDRRDINNLVRLADYDIPNFDGFKAEALGNHLFVAGVGGGVAVVDMSNPSQPNHLLTISTAGAARSIEIAGSVLIVANGSTGVEFIDVSTPTSPHVLGAERVPGSAWDVALSRGAIYVAGELGITSIVNAAVPPVLNELRLTITPAASSTTVAGAAETLAGVSPMTTQITNDVTSAASFVTPVNANGSFTAVVDAQPGQPLTLRATDVAGRTTTRSLGATHGTTTSQIANPSVALNDTNFRARRVASDGTVSLVGTGSLWSSGTPASNKLILFAQPNATAAPQILTYNGGAVQDLDVRSGYAFVAGDRLGTINLTTLTQAFAADQSGSDISLAVGGNFAYTGMDSFNNGTINIYDISNPAAPVHRGSPAVAGVSGLVYRGLVAYGSDYLIAFTPDRPNGVDKDVTIIKRTSPSTLQRIVEIPIPNFDAIDGAVSGTTLYVAGGDGGVAIIDLSVSPELPQLRTIINTPGIARGIAVSGPNEIVVADAGGPGITFIDVTDKSNPFIISSQRLLGNVTDVYVAGSGVYVAAENHFHTVIRP
jgi:hypothetical protein